MSYWSAKGFENAAHSKFFATQRNAAYFQNRETTNSRDRERTTATSKSHFRWQETALNYFIAGKFNGNTITNSRGRVSSLSLFLLFFPLLPSPSPISLTPSMSTASRIRNRKLVTRPTVCSEGGVYPSG